MPCARVAHCARSFHAVAHNNDSEYANNHNAASVGHNGKLSVSRSTM